VTVDHLKLLIPQAVASAMLAAAGQSRSPPRAALDLLP
jgi:hypothetical protein